MRTCDSCFEKYGPKDSDSANGETVTKVRKERRESGEGSSLPQEYLNSPLSKQPQVPEKPAGGKSEVS